MFLLSWSTSLTSLSTITEATQKRDFGRLERQVYINLLDPSSSQLALIICSGKKKTNGQSPTLIPAFSIWVAVGK